MLGQISSYILTRKLLFSTGNLCPSPCRDRRFLLSHAFIKLLNFKSCSPFKTGVLHLINNSDKLHSTYLSKSITTQSLLINSYHKLSWTELFIDACLKNSWPIYLSTGRCLKHLPGLSLVVTELWNFRLVQTLIVTEMQFGVRLFSILRVKKIMNCISELTTVYYKWWLRASHYSKGHIHEISFNPHNTFELMIIFPVLTMRKQSHWESEYFAQGHSAWKWWYENLSQIFRDYALNHDRNFCNGFQEIIKIIVYYFYMMPSLWGLMEGIASSSQ